jgi:hypothetical protein
VLAVSGYSLADRRDLRDEIVRPGFQILRILRNIPSELVRGLLLKVPRYV